MIVAILYFIDKHHLWKKAAVVAFILLVVAGLGWKSFGWYADWHLDRYTRQHMGMKSAVIAGYKDASTASQISHLCDDPLFIGLTEGEKQEVFQAVRGSKYRDWSTYSETDQDSIKQQLQAAITGGKLSSVQMESAQIAMTEITSCGLGKR